MSLLDHYENVVIGTNARGVICNAKKNWSSPVHTDRAEKIEKKIELGLGGALSTNFNEMLGTATFIELKLVGPSDSGPHSITFDAELKTTAFVRSLKLGFQKNGLNAFLLPCEENFFLDEEKCFKCPAGAESKRGATSFNACKCKDGRLMTSRRTCEDCGKGWENNNGRCKLCPAGKFKDSQGSGQCDSCPADTWSEKQGSTSEINCEFYYLNTSIAVSRDSSFLLITHE